VNCFRKKGEPSNGLGNKYQEKNAGGKVNTYPPSVEKFSNGGKKKKNTIQLWKKAVDAARTRGEEDQTREKETLMPEEKKETLFLGRKKKST